MMNLYWKEFAPLFQSARVYKFRKMTVNLFMLSFREVIITESCFGRRQPITNGRHQKFVQLLLIPSIALAQIYFVLVLISTNDNARYLYPEMDISRTVCPIASSYHLNRGIRHLKRSFHLSSTQGGLSPRERIITSHYPGRSSPPREDNHHSTCRFGINIQIQPRLKAKLPLINL